MPDAVKPEAAVQPVPEPQAETEAHPTEEPGAAARSEVAEVNPNRILEIQGLRLELPEKMPFRALRYARHNKEITGSDIYFTLECIVGEEQMEKVDDLDLTMDEGDDLLTNVFKRMGVDTGG